ncbi:hypothetical protein AAY473_003248, partial [Plecturocebus cupreus]
MAFHHICQAGLELLTPNDPLPQPPKVLELQVARREKGQRKSRKLGEEGRAFENREIAQTNLSYGLLTWRNTDVYQFVMKNAMEHVDELPDGELHKASCRITSIGSEDPQRWSKP